jgi:DNA repair protein RecO (recombination protein O)
LRGSGGHQTLEGVVLSVRDWGDAHRIVDLLSAQVGRIGMVARGARASRRRFAGALDLFVSLRVETRPRGDLWSLEAADVLGSRLGIRRSLAALQRASVIAECARTVAPEQQPVPDLHAAVVAALDALDRGELDAAVAVYPEVLATAGISPDPGLCASCGARHPDRICLDDSGSVRCARCAGTRTLFASAALRPGGPVPVGDGARAVERAVVALVEAHLGRRLKSVGVFSA